MKYLWAAAAASLLSGAAAPALAAERGFYAGLAGTIAAFDGRYDKATYQVDAAGARGAGFRGRDDADDALRGVGAVLGYRWALPGAGAWLSAEFEWLAHSGELRGRSPAACDHAPPCDWSLDNWADDWTLAPDSSRGLTLRLGFPADFLGPGASLYALAGLRRVRADRVLVYSGCTTTAWSPGAVCAPRRDGAPGYVRDVRSSRGVDFDAWTLGAGAEWPLNGAYALQAEARYADYGRERRLSAFPGGEVPSALSGREFGLALRALRHF